MNKIDSIFFNHPFIFKNYLIYKIQKTLFNSKLVYKNLIEVINIQEDTIFIYIHEKTIRDSINKKNQTALKILQNILEEINSYNISNFKKIELVNIGYTKKFEEKKILYLSDIKEDSYKKYDEEALVEYKKIYTEKMPKGFFEIFKAKYIDNKLKEEKKYHKCENCDNLCHSDFKLCIFCQNEKDFNEEKLAYDLKLKNIGEPIQELAKKNDITMINAYKAYYSLISNIEKKIFDATYYLKKNKPFINNYEYNMQFNAILQDLYLFLKIKYEDTKANEIIDKEYKRYYKIIQGILNSE